MVNIMIKCRKLLCLIMVALLVCPGLSVEAAYAQGTNTESEEKVYVDSSSGYTLKYIEKDGNIKITDCAETSEGNGGKEITFPDTIDGKKVTGIGRTILDDVAVTIFNDCSNLTKITIPSSVTNIESCALADCNSLLEIIVESGNQAYESDDAGVLYNKGKTSLVCCPGGKKEISIPSGVTSIQAFAFRYCSNLTKISIPSSMTSIGDGAFLGCSSLTSISIPSSVTSIGDWAFDCCSSLTGISIPSSVMSIGDGAFRGCSSLTEITIPDGVTSIGRYAFDECNSLTKISIPSGVTSIREYAFRGCSSLKDVYYAGSQEQWSQIEIEDDDNENLTSATIHYGSTSAPQKSGQVITAGNITTTYGAKPFSLNASVNTGTALTYAVSDDKVAAVNPQGQVTVIGCGITNITITAPETDVYSRAEKTITLTVKPKKVKLLSVKSTKPKKADVKWKRDKKASGYLIVCATDKKFKKNKVQMTVKKNKKVSATVKKLKPRKKYYVRVCAYTDSGSTRVQGNWSKVKTVRIKK